MNTQGLARGNRERFSFVKFYNKVGIFFILIILVGICSMLSPVFLSKANLLNLLTQTAVVSIIACGITLLVITGNTDLSAGSVVAFVGCVVLGTYKSLTEAAGLAPFPAGLLAVGAGILLSIALYGAASFIITRYRAPAFIVTLAISTSARGLALMYTNAKVIKSVGKIVNLGQGKLFGEIPFPVVFMVLIAVLTWVLLTQTRMGRYLYAIGGNPESAKAAGINTNRTIVMAYLFHAVCVAIAGALFMSRLNSGQPAEAVGLEFDAITAAIIGGASLAGGIGTITGTIVGSLIIGMISNILTLTHVQSYYQQIITGLVIVFAVVVDIKTKGGSKRF